VRLRLDKCGDFVFGQNAEIYPRTNIHDGQVLRGVEQKLADNLL
jgi:hypothetical protein